MTQETTVQILVIALTAAVNVAVTLAVVRVELKHMRAAIVRAHKRLDAINAPNVTSEEVS